MGTRLENKTIVVTGGTSGIGFAAVKTLVNAGAFVIGVGRNEERIIKAQKEIINNYPDAKITYLLADLSSQKKVISLGDKVKEVLNKNGSSHLDVLINNAGVYLEKRKITEDGVEMTFAVDHLAPFLLTHQLLGYLKNSENGKVLTVSSYSHRTTPLCLNRVVKPWPYLSLLAYKRAKLCNVLFSYELKRRHPELTAFAIDPGLVNTAIASKGSRGISHWVWKYRRNSGTSPDVPARTILFLASSNVVDTSNGCYFKNCEPIAPSGKAQDPILAKKLWDLSCKVTCTDW